MANVEFGEIVEMTLVGHDNSAKYVAKKLSLAKIFEHGMWDMFSVIDNAEVLAELYLYKQHAGLETLYWTDKFLYLIIGKATGGNLAQLVEWKKERIPPNASVVKLFDEKYVKQIAKELLIALEYKPEQSLFIGSQMNRIENYPHKMISPKNVHLTTEGHVQLTYLGIRTSFSDKYDLYFKAPQQFASNTRLKERWELGVLIFYLLTGTTPYETDDATDLKTMQYNIMNKNLFLPPDLSPEGDKFLMGLLKGQFDQESLINHSWFQEKRRKNGIEEIGNSSSIPGLNNFKKMRYTPIYNNEGQYIGFQDSEIDSFSYPHMTTEIDKKLNEIRLRWRNVTQLLRKSHFSFHHSNKPVVLGKGVFGKVYLVTLKSDSSKYFAAKVIPKINHEKEYSVDRIAAEITALTILTSRYITELIAFDWDDDNIYIILKLAQGGPFYKFLHHVRQISEEDARFYLSEIVLAVGYLHSKKIVHRDLKTDNFLLDEHGHIVLCDFGLSETVDRGGQGWYKAGNIDYTAPETFEIDPTGKDHISISSMGDAKLVDWYAVGVIAYQMIYGEKPWPEDKKLKLLVIKNKSITDADFPAEPVVSIQAKDFIKSLLKINLHERALIAGHIDNIKNHSFFKRHESLPAIRWDDLQNQQPPYKVLLRDDHTISYTKINENEKNNFATTA